MDVINQQADATRKKGLEALSEAFRSHRQKAIDMEVQRRQTVEKARTDSMAQKLDEIEFLRSSAHRKVDAEADGRNQAIERTRGTVEADAKAKATEHLMADQKAALDRKLASGRAALDDLEAGNARVKKAEADMQSGLDRGYIKQRLLEMEVWRNIQAQNSKIADPDIRAQQMKISEDLHNQRLAQFESEYRQGCIENSRRTAEGLQENLDTFRSQNKTADELYNNDMRAARETSDNILRSAQEGLNRQHSEVDAWAQSQKGDLDQQARDRLATEPGKAADEAGASAKKEADSTFSKQYKEHTQHQEKIGYGLRKDMKPGQDAVKKALKPEAKPVYTQDNQNPAKADPKDHWYEQKVVNVERPNPSYQDPPGSVEELDAIQAEIEGILGQRAQAAAAQSQMEQELAVVQGQQPQADQVVQKSTDAMAAADAQKAKVAEKKSVTQQQGQKVEELQGKSSQYSGYSAGFSKVTTPLKGFQKFTWIASKLPGSAGAAMGRINEKATMISGAFDNMNAQMGNQQQANSQRKAAIQDKTGRLDATADQANESGAQLQTAADGAQSLAQTNQEKVSEATAARDEAKNEGSDLEKQAQDKKKRKDELTASLSAWAVQHRQARLDTIERQRRNAGGNPKGTP